MVDLEIMRSVGLGFALDGVSSFEFLQCSDSCLLYTSDAADE